MPRSNARSGKALFETALCPWSWRGRSRYEHARVIFRGSIDQRVAVGVPHVLIVKTKFVCLIHARSPLRDTYPPSSRRSISATASSAISLRNHHIVVERLPLGKTAADSFFRFEYDDVRCAVFHLRRADCALDSLRVVPAADALGVPAERAELFYGVEGIADVAEIAVELALVLVHKHDEAVELMCARRWRPPPRPDLPAVRRRQRRRTRG